jgi:hypothetical protein
VSEGDAIMSDQAWNLVPKPKHRAVFRFAEHYDYLYNQPLPCRDTGLGPCPHVGLATDDLVTMFFANYLPPELWPDLPNRVPNNLIPPPLSLTPEQRFYASGHLVGMTTFNGAAQCTVTVTVELPLDKTVPMVLEMTQTQAAQQVHSAGLVAKFTGPTSPGVPWVSAQSPTAGTRVAAGSTVSMTLRVGPIP